MYFKIRKIRHKIAALAVTVSMAVSAVPVFAESEAIDMEQLLNSDEIVLYDSHNIEKENRTPEQMKTETLKLFDNNPETFTDYRVNGKGNGGFVIFDFGGAYEVSLSKVDIQARQDRYYDRLKNTVIQGTNELPDPWYKNEGWKTLTTSAEATTDMQTLEVTDTASYRYIRMYNSGNWFGNAAELVLYGTRSEYVPPTEEKKQLQTIVDSIVSDDAVMTYIKDKGNDYLESDTVRASQIEDLIALYNSCNQAEIWIENDINPWYFERLGNKLVENSFSEQAKIEYNEAVNSFYSKGSELDENIIRDMGPEFVMSDEEKDMTLADRISSAVSRAKAQIDQYPDENYIMLKELISYMTRGDDSKYCDTPDKYGSDAQMCEYVITNINYTLQNLDGNAKLTDKLDYKSGTTWLDKYGSKISAGGGQIIEGGDGKYYWYGEDNKVAYALHTGVACYSTTDFSQWTYEGLAFNAFTDEIEANKMFAEDLLTDSINGTQGRIERPKVLYNESNDTYVMWMHLERNGDYSFSSAGVAVSSNGPTGPFEWKWFGRPVCDEYTTYNGKLSQTYRDMTLFKEDDGTAYVLYSTEGNKVPYLCRLNKDYTWIDTEGMNTVSKEDFETGRVSYDAEGMYYTGKLYNYNSDGTGYVDEEGNDITLTDEDLKTLTYLDTTTSGHNGQFWAPAKHNYYLPSYNRYQLTSGNKIFIRQGDKVDREDGLDTLPLTKGEYGRWAKIGQYESGFSNQREAPAIIKHDGYFYMVASGISGWKANAGIYLRTKSPFDEWETVENPFKGEGQKNYAETSYSYNLGYWSFMPDTGKSFLSQSTCLFEYNGTVYYMGDRWKDADYWDGAHLGVKKSTYVWAPVVFKDNGDKADNMEIYWTDTIDFSNTSDPDVSIESVTKTDGKIDFSVKLENAPSDSMLITALYDSNNNLVKILVGSESGSFEVEADKNYVFKAMLWNDEQKPLTDARSQEV